MPYMFSITVPSSKIVGSDKTKFPVLFNENCTSIPASFWSNILDTTSGLDIRFYDLPGKITEYSREIVNLDYTGQTFESWIQIPVLSSSMDTTFVCQVGDSTRANDTSLWSDLGAMGIYHLSDGSDSGGRGNDGTLVDVTSVNGYISNAYSFDGTSSHIELTSNMDFTSIVDLYSISAWANLRGTWPASVD